MLLYGFYKGVPPGLFLKLSPLTSLQKGLKLEERSGPLFHLLKLFWKKNSSCVSGLSLYIFVALHVRMFVAGANKVEGT